MNYKERTQKERLEFAKYKLEELGYDMFFENKTELRLEYNGCRIKYYPYSGWYAGKSIKDGRGLNNLLKQLKLDCKHNKPTQNEKYQIVCLECGKILHR